MYKHFTYIILFLLVSLFCNSQNSERIDLRDLTVSGRVQNDMLFPGSDGSADIDAPDAKFHSNSFGDLSLSWDNLEAGLRFEMYKQPMPGFEAAYEGVGIPFFYVSGQSKNIRFTAGNFYEQFGSGLIFRTYEDRTLGLDNSLRGGSLTWNSRGIVLKLLGGNQRYYWDYPNSSVFGADAGIELDEWVSRLRESDIRLQWGLSFVTKYQPSEVIMATLTERLNLPERVGAMASRFRFQRGKVSLMTEFALKANDPSADNQYIYKNGSALLFSGSWSQKGMGLVIQAKRSDNMSFRSRRTETGRMLTINHLPAFTRQHAWALASLYPYATQAGGEWAFQGEWNQLFSRGTFPGGVYGTNLRIHFSRIQSIDKTGPAGRGINPRGTNGYTSAFFAFGNELYYQDINLEISKKISKGFTLTGMVMNQAYNQAVIEGHANNGRIIRSHIIVLEGKQKVSDKLVLRSELQTLLSRQDDGNWLFGLLELSAYSSWMFTVSDMYNSGETNIHYFMGSAVWSHNAHRLQFSWGKTRAGFNCSGGICRYVPAHKGFQVSYAMSF